MKIYEAREGMAGASSLFGAPAVEIVERETQTTSTGRVDITNETVVAVCQAELAPVILQALRHREFLRLYWDALADAGRTLQNALAQFQPTKFDPEGD